MAWVGHSHPSNRDRTFMLSAPRAPRPVWESSAWWHQQADALPQQACGKQVTHGLARVEFSVTRLGRTLGYHCLTCGWGHIVLVQEGAGHPEAPVTQLDRGPRRMARRAGA